MITDEEFKRGFRRLASGVSCVTTSWKGHRHGFVATSVSSLSSNPPTLLVCVNQATSSHDPISESGILCVNVLRQEDSDIATRFGDKRLRDTRFLDRLWIEMETGAPVLMDALVAFDCRVEQKFPYGTHTIFIGRIVDAHFNESVDSPLLYFDGLYRELAGEADGVGQRKSP